MIRKQDILDRAREWQLRPDIVEKDYVLGWLLGKRGGIVESASPVCHIFKIEFGPRPLVDLEEFT
jgi:hypothetical protein